MGQHRSMRRSGVAVAAVIVFLLLPGAASAETATGGKVVVASTATIRPDRALIRVFCNGPQACEGVLELVASKTKRGAAVVALGEASFRLEPGVSKVLRLQLSPAGRRLLDSGEPLKARVSGSSLHPHVVKLKPVTA